MILIKTAKANQRSESSSEIKRTVPVYKRFNGIIFGKAYSVICRGSREVAIFGALPEFSRVAAQKQRAVFLRRMTKDRFPFFFGVARREGNGNFDFIQRPFLPSAAIEQNFRQFLSFFFYLRQYGEDNHCAYAMCSVRIGKIACDKDYFGI